MAKRDVRQLQLPLGEGPKLRVIQGLGQKKPNEKLVSRNAVARVLMGAGADLLLKRISSERAEVIERLRREQPENEPVDDAVGREAVRRLVELEQGGPRGMLADEYFEQLEARARAESG